MRSNLYILLSALLASMAISAPLPLDDDAVLDGGTHFYRRTEIIHRNHDEADAGEVGGGDSPGVGKRSVVVEEVGVHRVEERGEGGSGAGFPWVEPPPPPPPENLKAKYLLKMLADLQAYKEDTERKIAAGRKAAECSKVFENALPFAVEPPAKVPNVKSPAKTNRELLQRLFNPPPSPPRSPEEEMAVLEARRLKAQVAQRTLRFDLQAAYSEGPLWEEKDY